MDELEEQGGEKKGPKPSLSMPSSTMWHHWPRFNNYGSVI